MRDGGDHSQGLGHGRFRVGMPVQPVRMHMQTSMHILRQPHRQAGACALACVCISMHAYMCFRR